MLNPWISDKTLQLVDERKKVKDKHSNEYKEMSIAVKKSAKPYTDVFIEKRRQEIEINF